MLNFRQNIFTQSVTICLAWLLTLSPVTFHWQLLDHPPACTSCLAPDESACDCCQPADDGHQKTDHANDQAPHNCYCFSFSHLVSILPELDIHHIPLKQPFYMLVFQIKIPQVDQNVFRPPKG